MDEAAFSVIPVPGGWAVEQPSDGPLMFLSGAQAEAKAHELARRAHRSGQSASALIYDRDRMVLGRSTYRQANLVNDLPAAGT
jgi:hypothetical protein